MCLVLHIEETPTYYHVPGPSKISSAQNGQFSIGGSLYEPFMQKVNDHVRMLCIVHIARIYRAHAITREKKYQSMMNDE